MEGHLLRNGMLDIEAILDTFLNSTGECIIFVDRGGYIEVLSKAYADFLRVDQKEAIGKHVTEVVENTRLPVVLKTGKAELAQPHIIRGANMIASRIPLYKNGEIIGAFGRVLFKDIDDLRDLYEKIEDMEKELSSYKKSFSENHRPHFSTEDIITQDPQMLALIQMISRVSNTYSNVLILGESGTGKELFAHAVHHASRRRHQPFLTLNCGAIPQDLLESELFGYLHGAFTGARREGKIGLLKAADGGTIFLDEIGELPLPLQVKLLRFLQSREVTRLGSNTTEKVDVRVIAATNRNLQHMLESGEFRADLYYRLNVVVFDIPPLRKRRGDIPLLARYLIEKISRREHLRDVELSDAANAFLRRYSWPGNVRELENVLESAINFMGPDKIIQPEQLPPRVTGYGGLGAEENFSPPQNLKDSLDMYEKQLVLNALRNHRYNKTKAAVALQISRTSLYEKMEKHNISDK
ncbi:sigma 54-interacting transcriptional regulator [Ruminococcaceae bacterium OttesenSCG-928-A16]|nr:sigma 54-interacting transcriptional regulator [Ruminococcaceae bacterium OttesenSCG-928-A16]